MPIVCGTDFSKASVEAGVVAGALARRLSDTLYLVHAAGPASVPAHSAVELLSHAAESLRERGVMVAECVELGPPERVLADVAARTKSMLIFVGAPERRSKTLLGSTADKTTRESPVPVLTIRDGDSFREWLEGTRPLRVLVATDLSSVSQAAVDWVASLRRIGSVDVVLAHVFWPPSMDGRLELSGPMFRRRVHPVVREVLERELAMQAATLGGSGFVRTWVQPNLGRTADPLVLMASQERADLLVVGTHQRKALDRAWHGSVSKTIVLLAPMNVACVPARQSQDAIAVPPMRTIVAATDFSATGNLAVAHAYAIAHPGSHVILIHAVKLRGGATPEEAARPDCVDAEKRLRALVPPLAAVRDIETTIRVLEGHDAAATICGAAERFAADVVVVGTEGRAGLARPIFGSVAQEVMLRSRSPVLIVPPAHILATRVTAPAAEREPMFA